jgi:uncharacterized membrane protein
MSERKLSVTGSRDADRAEFSIQELHNPFPDANTLAQLEQAHAGAAERVLLYFEKEQVHRHSQDKDGFELTKRELELNKVRTSQRYAVELVSIGAAFLLYFFVLALAGFSLYMGQNWGFYVFGGGALVLGISQFLRRRLANTPAKT